jgi:DNA-directed RNA polymerase specialized sigma subunit
VVAVKRTYEVVAKRWRRGWELHIPGVGVTQSRSLAEAEEMARDYIASDLDVDEGSFDVRVTPEVGDGVDQKVAQTRAEISAAALAQTRAAEGSRALVNELKELGLSGKDTAAVLGITPQRVSQLARPRSGKTAASKLRHRDTPAAETTRTRDTSRS